MPMTTSITKEGFVSFLRDALNPDPSVQEQNVVVLDQLTHSPSAAVIDHALTILTDSSQFSSPLRQVSISVLKRLLTRNPEGVLAVSGTAFQLKLPTLLDAFMVESQAVMTTAIASLIALFLAKTSDLHSPASVDSTWGILFALVERETTHTAKGAFDEASCVRIINIATLLQVLCEDCPSQLLKWIAPQSGGRESEANFCSARSLALCSVFQGLLKSSCAALGPVLTDRVVLSASLSPAAAFTSVLAALTSCFEENVLPCEDPFSDGDENKFIAGPAATGLSVVLDQVAATHAYVADFAVSTVFPMIQRQSRESSLEDYHARLLIVLVKYMSLMVLASGREIHRANESLLRAALTTLTEYVWPACTETTSDEMEKAVNASLSYVGDAAFLANSSVFFLCLPQIFNAMLPLAALPQGLLCSSAFMRQENDVAEPDDPASVKLVLSGARASVGVDVESESDDGEDEKTQPRKKGHENAFSGNDDEDNISGSARRALIATVINNISAAYENPDRLVEYLFPAASSNLGTFLAAPSQNDPRVAEAVLFVLNETVEECLASPHLSHGQGRQIGELAWRTQQSLQERRSSASAVPFYVRHQAIRFLGRSTAAAVEAVLLTGSSPASEYLSVVSPESLLGVLSSLLASESSKVVQKQCMTAITVICAASLRAPVGDLDVESDDDSDGTEAVGEQSYTHISATAGASTVKSNAFGAHLRAVLFSSADSAPIQFIFAQLLETFPRLQLGPRAALYEFFSTVIPLMSDRGVPLNQPVVGRALEMLAVHCQSLGFEPDKPTCGEAAYVMVTMSQVVAALGALAAPAVPFFAAMARHVMEVCLTHRSQACPLISTSTSSNAGSANGSIDLADMCELSMDLLSVLCDVMVDHDRLLPLMLKGVEEESPETREAVEKLSLVRQALFSPSAAGGPDVLRLCTRLLSASPSSSQTSGPVAGVENGDLRRASFGVIYDCLFIASPESRAEVFWTLVEQVVVEEVGPLVTAASTQQMFEVVEARETTLVNALLCLGELLALHSPDNAATGILTSTMKVAYPFLLQTMDSFLTILRGKGKKTVALPTNVRLNMINALSGIGALLSACAPSLQVPPTQAVEQGVTVVNAVAAEIGSFASALEEDGCYECVQVLTTVCRTVRSLCGIAQLPLSQLLSSSQPLAASLARILVVVAKCAKALPDQRAAAVVLEDWVAIADAVASLGASTLQLTKREKHSIEAVSRLGNAN